LLAVLLWSVVAAPLTVRPATVQAAPPEQAQGVVVLPVCAATMAAAAVCVGGAAFITWYIYSGQYNQTAADLQSAWDWFSGWWSSNPNSATRQAVEQSFATTPYYIYPTQAMINEWATGYASIGSPWYVRSPGYVGFTQTNTTSSGGGQTLVVNLSAGFTPTYTPGTCTGTDITAYLTTDNTTTTRWDADLYGSNNGGVTYSTSQHAPVGFVGDWGIGPGNFISCSALETGAARGKLVVRPRQVSGQAALPQVYVGRVRIRVTAGGQYYYTYLDVAFWEPTPAGSVIAPVAGERLNVPTSLNSLIGYTPATSPAVPLAQGGTGAVVVQPGAIPTQTTDDPGFWEGLFHGVTGGLSDVWNKLGEILDALKALGLSIADILTAIGAVPNAVVGAFTDAFVPTQTPQARMASTIDTAKTKAPFAWPGAIFSGVAALFAGAGSTCPTVTIPNHSFPYWTDYTMTLCPPAGTGPIVKMLSRLVALGILAVWGYILYRRLVGGEA